MKTPVTVRRDRVVLPTYEPAAPDRNPMFLEKRVYQGSSGRVYPLPVIDRIAEMPVDREWEAITLENGLVEVMLLPEIGGRVHAIRDLSNGYDAIYRQHVIKPALVGLTGPWVSGGIEFNWPQHHRPSTFMPTDVAIEHGSDGSVTVWMGEHDPMDRTKGMHGICLHPGRSVVEIRGRIYNRTPYPQSFLWWTNIGTHVHQGYKSFFPPDAVAVADHAKRAISKYPGCDGRYYGVDYGDRRANGVPVDERPGAFIPANCGGQGPMYAPNDLSWYANIPVPTSYMCVGTEQEFLGGYDAFAEAGLLHVADHHICPGKKQWTWGNHKFGYAWDRNLTESDGPYIELMAGVYTDNQPDFSFIAPGETRSFSQFLYPYRQIGPVQFANVDLAISVSAGQVGVAATREIHATVRVTDGEGCSVERQVDLAPDRPWLESFGDARSVAVEEHGVEIGRYEGCEPSGLAMKPAIEPPLPKDVASSDELYVIGLHLMQYRHATRSAADYWREALSRDPGDSRCNNGLGSWHLRRGEFETAREHFQRAIERLTSRNPNPYDGEPYYNLGLAERFLGRYGAAEAAFGKATWNAAWRAPAYYALAELCARRRDWTKAMDYLDQCIRMDADHLAARNLRTQVGRKVGLAGDVEEVLALDPLDAWAHFLAGRPVPGGNATRIDLAIDMSRAGLWEPALETLDSGDGSATDGTAPMLGYYRAFVLAELGQDTFDAYTTAAQACPDYCFPSRLEDIAVLRSAPRGDGRAHFYLGNLLYDARRHEEAICEWEQAAALEPRNSVVHRNLGIAYSNVRRDPARARRAYDDAVGANPEDARLRYERDQLWKCMGVQPAERLAALRERLDLVARRDDLTLEFCSLLNSTGESDEAARILASRRFQPWEGGEGMALGGHVRTQLSLGRRALSRGDAATARSHFESANTPPENLGEARHLLANASDVWLALGDAHAALGEPEAAEAWWGRAANFRGDFQEMEVRPYSEYTYFRALALRRLGRESESWELLARLRDYAEALETAEAKIDYFATSLPTMLLFDDDLQVRQATRGRFILAQVAVVEGDSERVQSLLSQLITADPNHALAADLWAEISGNAESSAARLSNVATLRQ